MDAIGVDVSVNLVTIIKTNISKKAKQNFNM